MIDYTFCEICWWSFLNWHFGSVQSIKWLRISESPNVIEAACPSRFWMPLYHMETCKRPPYQNWFKCRSRGLKKYAPRAQKSAKNTDFDQVKMVAGFEEVKKVSKKIKKWKKCEKTQNFDTKVLSPKGISENFFVQTRFTGSETPLWTLKSPKNHCFSSIARWVFKNSKKFSKKYKGCFVLKNYYF